MHGLDMDMLVDQLDRLRAEAVPEELAVPTRRPHRLIHFAQPAVVAPVALEEAVGRERLPELREDRVVSREGVAPFVVRKALLREDESFVATDTAIHVGEICEARSHRQRELLLQLV